MRVVLTIFTIIYDPFPAILTALLVLAELFFEVILRSDALPECSRNHEIGRAEDKQW